MNKKDLNRGWLFGAEGKEPSMQPVTLPHDAMLYEKRSKDAATAGACGYFPGGAYVYVKRFLVPETWRTQSAVLEFEAALPLIHPLHLQLAVIYLPAFQYK